MRALVLAALILAAPACGGPRPSGIRYAPQPTPACGVVRPYELPEPRAERPEPEPEEVARPEGGAS
jgi:hypothetical protein